MSLLSRKKAKIMIDQLEYTHRLWANSGIEAQALQEVIGRLEAKVSAGKKLSDIDVRVVALLVADVNPWPN